MSSYTKEGSAVSDIVIPALKGLAVAVIAAAVLLFSMAAVAYGTDDPDSVAGILGYAVLYVSSAVAGAVASRINGDSGGLAVAAGGAAGAMLLAVILMMSLLPAETARESPSPLVTVIMHLAIPAAAALSGLIFRRKPHRRIKHKKRR